MRTLLLAIFLVVAIRCWCSDKAGRVAARPSNLAYHSRCRTTLVLNRVLNPPSLPASRHRQQRRDRHAVHRVMEREEPPEPSGSGDSVQHGNNDDEDEESGTREEVVHKPEQVPLPAPATDVSVDSEDGEPAATAIVPIPGSEPKGKCKTRACYMWSPVRVICSTRNTRIRDPLTQKPALLSLSLSLLRSLLTVTHC